MASPMTRGQYPVLTTRAGLKKIYFNEYAQLRELYTSVFNTMTSNRGFEDFLKVSGLGRMQKIDENEAITYDSAVEGNRVLAIPEMYALGFQVSRVLVDDELYNIIGQMTKALARSVRYEQEVQAWGLINDSFAGSSYTGFDGLALCHDSHTMLKGDGATWDNKLASDLAASSLEAAVDLFALSVDDQNMNIAIEPKMLLVPAQGRWTASTLVESPFDPESDTNAKNPLVDVGLTWMASPFITDTDAFWLFSDKANHDLMFIWRLRPETEDTVDFDTKALKFSVIQRFVPHFNEPRGVVGSTGAG